MYTPKKVIVWGHPLYSHTSSYVHGSFVKAFKFLGYDTYWLSNDSDVSGVDFEGSMFLTEGQVDEKMPKRRDCKYVLHNCDLNKYQDVPPSSILRLQVCRESCPEYNAEQYASQKLYDGVFIGKGILFQPWGTDLLPHEINLDDCRLPRERASHWVGTIGGQLYGNENEIAPYEKACRETGIRFEYHGPTSTSYEENRLLIQKSYMAPAIHGAWQVRNGYVACRLYKNISYGHLGVTNCPAAINILGNTLVCNTDTFQMFRDAEPHLADHARIMEQMKLVRDKYTYVNSIKNILWALDQL